MAYEVFISYSSLDRPVAEAVRAALASRGFACWMAPRAIVPGQNWREAIIQGIRASRAMVLVLSNQSLQSKQVFREADRADHHNLALVPFRIDGSIPQGCWEYLLSGIHWLDGFPPPWERWLPILGDAVDAQLRWHRQRPASKPISGDPPPPNSKPISDDHLRETIAAIVDRMIEQRQLAVPMSAFSRETQARIDELANRGLARRQLSLVEPHAEYVRFCKADTCRQALAEWAGRNLADSCDDLLQQTTAFPLLADGLAEYVSRQWESDGKALLRRWAHFDVPSVQRLVAATVESLASCKSRFAEATALLLSAATTPAVRGLAFGAQRLMETGELEPARQLWERIANWSRRQPESFENERFLLEIANEQGRLLRRAGRIEDARRHFQQTLKDAEHTGDQRLLGVVTNNYARTVLETANAPAIDEPPIVDIIKANVARLEAFGESNDLAVAYHNLAEALAKQDPAAAESYYRRDAELCRRLNDPTKLIDSLDALGLFLSDNQRWGEAEAAYREGIALIDGLFDLPRQARLLANLGRCLFRQSLASDDRRSGLRQARDICEQSRSVYSSLDEPQEFAPLLENLSRICYLLDDVVGFCRCMPESIRQYERWPAGRIIASELRAELGHLLDGPLCQGANESQSEPPSP